jgi:glycosyltransferase involved in cell wall biosynthesis
VKKKPCFQPQTSAVQSDIPFVSIIVPVRNAPGRIQTCIEALLDQTYPQDRYEIIVVDNGSTDNTPQVIQSYPVCMLVENRGQSPYSARNRGLEYASGSLIALIDASCCPVPKWLACGVSSLLEEPADLVGGKITFTFSPEKTIGEIVDSLYNVQVKNYIENEKGTVTGNLFVRKSVVDAIGLFPERIRSGGDMFWTRRATDAGFKVVYASRAEVFYPARKLVPLLKKQYRVGRGLPRYWSERGYSSWKILSLVIEGFLPSRPWCVLVNIRNRGTPDMVQKLFAIWLVRWLQKSTVSIGTLHTLLENILHNKGSCSQTKTS